MSNNKPYLNPSMFTKPPPNFKNNHSQWNSFKIPFPPNNSTTNNSNNNVKSPTRYSSPQATSRRRYSNSPTNPSNSIRNYKNEPPPNYQSQNMESSPASSKKYKKDLVYNPVGTMQPFKVDIPPPHYKKSSPYTTNDKSDAASPSFNSSPEGKKLVYYNSMLYRYYNGSCPPSFPSSQMSYTQTSTESYNVPPPSHQYSSLQPPLPTLPPPQNPPLPPAVPESSATGPVSSMQNHSMVNHNHHQIGNYNRMSSYSGYANPYHNNYKRKYEGMDAHRKIQKKKKKPLSQIVPQKRDWTLEEAKKALNVEKEYNKRSKRQGLIIKFPDLELNRDIVSNFHTSIESVHFQQPSTPRYCFVTLRESADPETVIKQLNQIPFGLGYLSAEYKKDREDEQNIKPTDIDPLTLYVGNLAQEITKEDMTKTYPNQKRIDIGYAKKMKYTRYAFVSFHSVDDAIEAFQRTHSSQMYSKSLIVRFRRLHGTVGMPGEAKQMNNSTNPRADSMCESSNNSVHDETETANPWDIDVSHWESDFPEVKHHSDDDDDDDDDEPNVKPPISPENFKTRLTTPIPALLELDIPKHRPKIISIKKEKDDDQSLYDTSQTDGNIENERADSPIEFRSVASPQDRPAPSAHRIDVSTPRIDVSAPRIDVGANEEQFQMVLANIKKEKTEIKTERIQEYSNSADTVSMKKENDDRNGASKEDDEMIVEENGVSDTSNRQIPSESNENNVESGSCEEPDGAERSCTGNDGESSTDNQYAGENFSWMNEDYLSQEIKTESDDQTHDGDDDSSDDELSIDNILKRTRNRCKRTNIQ